MQRGCKDMIGEFTEVAFGSNSRKSCNKVKSTII